MKVINKYFLKEITIPFITALGAFTFIFTLDIVLRVTRLIVDKNLNITLAFQIIANYLPSTLFFSLPMAFIMAIITAYGRLQSDFEILIMQMSGIHPFKFTVPAFKFAALIFFILFYVSFYLMPQSYHNFKALQFETAQTNPFILIEENKVIRIKDMSFYARQIDGAVLKNIYINQTNPRRIALAKTGEFLQDKESYILNLKDAVIHNITEKNYRIVQAKNFQIRIDAPVVRSRTKNVREKNLSELLNLNSFEAKKEITKRGALATAPLFFVFLSVALGLKMRKSMKGGSFGISLIVIFVYYILFLGIDNLTTAAAPNLVFLFFPNIAVLFAGYFLMRRDIK